MISPLGGIKTSKLIDSPEQLNNLIEKNISESNTFVLEPEDETKRTKLVAQEQIDAIVSEFTDIGPSLAETQLTGIFLGEFEACTKV